MSYYDFECGTCGKCFPAGSRARNSHCRATGHDQPDFECESCPRFFQSQAACDQHMRDKNHWPYECNRCYETFPSTSQRQNHELYDHLFCNDCHRDFNSMNGIRMHLNSSAHRGCDISCPFCPRQFVTATGLTHHLETGGCANAPTINRERLYNFVRSKDPKGVISKNLLEWKDTSEYEVDGRSWNGFGYECYLCNREFVKLSGLNQHINSAKHKSDLYHCPNCRASFKVLAGVINHLESESCGCTRFERVQRQISGLVTGNRLLTL